MINVNELIQTACEDLSLVDIDESVDGTLASVAERQLNIAIAELNRDNFISCTTKIHDVNCAGTVYFRKLETGEAKEPNTIDAEPPNSVSGVSRRIGMRYMSLIPARRQDLAAFATMGLPQVYEYQIEQETAPSGETRNVGKVYLNGINPCDLRIFVSAAIPKYKLGDKIYLPDLYYTLVLYALEVKLAENRKVYSYLPTAQKNLANAKDAIDKTAATNAPVVSSAMTVGGYNDNFYNGMAGVGM